MKTKLITFALISFLVMFATPFIFEHSIFIGTIYGIFALAGSFAVGAKMFSHEKLMESFGHKNKTGDE